MPKCGIRLLQCTVAPLSLSRASIRYLVEFEDAVIRKATGELLGSARRVSVQQSDDPAQRGARA
jgi:hypothetical protein